MCQYVATFERVSFEKKLEKSTKSWKITQHANESLSDWYTDALPFMGNTFYQIFENLQ